LLASRSQRAAPETTQLAATLIEAVPSRPSRRVS
jgi:hypothetical protein